MATTDSDADALLVERVKRGDVKAFEMLGVKYQRRIERLIGRMVDAWERLELGATNPAAVRLQPYQRVPSRVSSKGRSRAAMASRARKMRERTVPMGQFMTSAISS